MSSNNLPIQSTNSGVASLIRSVRHDVEELEQQQNRQSSSPPFSNNNSMHSFSPSVSLSMSASASPPSSLQRSSSSTRRLQQQQQQDAEARMIHQLRVQARKEANDRMRQERLAALQEESIRKLRAVKEKEQETERQRIEALKKAAAIKREAEAERQRHATAMQSAQDEAWKKKLAAELDESNKSAARTRRRSTKKNILTMTEEEISAERKKRSSFLQQRMSANDDDPAANNSRQLSQIMSPCEQHKNKKNNNKSVPNFVLSAKFDIPFPQVDDERFVMPPLRSFLTTTAITTAASSSSSSSWALRAWLREHEPLRIEIGRARTVLDYLLLISSSSSSLSLSRRLHNFGMWFRDFFFPSLLVHHDVEEKIIAPRMKVWWDDAQQARNRNNNNNNKDMSSPPPPPPPPLPCDGIGAGHKVLIQRMKALSQVFVLEVAAVAASAKNTSSVTDNDGTTTTTTTTTTAREILERVAKMWTALETQVHAHLLKEEQLWPPLLELYGERRWKEEIEPEIVCFAPFLGAIHEAAVLQTMTMSSQEGEDERRSKQKQSSKKKLSNYHEFLNQMPKWITDGDCLPVCISLHHWHTARLLSCCCCRADDGDDGDDDGSGEKTYYTLPPPPPSVGVPSPIAYLAGGRL